MKGNEKDICQAEAKANEKVAKAELEQKYEPSERHARKAEEVKAEGKYEVAKERCESNKDGASDCKKQAKAEYDKEKADIKAKHAKADSKRNRTAGTGASTTPTEPVTRNGCRPARPGSVPLRHRDAAQARPGAHRARAR